MKLPDPLIFRILLFFAFLALSANATSKVGLSKFVELDNGGKFRIAIQSQEPNARIYLKCQSACNYHKIQISTPLKTFIFNKADNSLSKSDLSNSVIYLDTNDDNLKKSLNSGIKSIDFFIDTNNKFSIKSFEVNRESVKYIANTI